MSLYTRYIFFCKNIRKDGKACCSQLNAKTMYRYAKGKCRQEGIMGEGKIGVRESHCLVRYEYGPVAVVYPDNVWYQILMKRTLMVLSPNT